MPTSPSAPATPVVTHVKDCYVHGSETWLHTQIAHLRKHDAFVLANTTNNLDRFDWTPPIYQTFGRPFIVRALDRVADHVLGYRPTFYRQAKRRGTTLLHAHFGPTGYETLPLARALDVPLLTTFYGYDLSMLPTKHPEWKQKYRTLFEEGAQFLVEGSHMRKTLIRLGCPPAKVQVHHLGVRLDQLPFCERDREPSTPLRILSAGRFTEKKGFPDAIRAFGRFLQNGGKGTLTIIGGHRDPKEHQQLKRKLQAIAADLDATDHLHFRGFIPLDELIEAYLEHDVLLSPSVTASNGDTEGGAPVTIIEAAATGLPAISTYHCDIPEVVKHGETGLLAPEHDVDTLAEHIQHVFDAPSFAREAGRAARAHVEAEYDAVKQGHRLDEVYALFRRDSRRV